MSTEQQDRRHRRRPDGRVARTGERPEMRPEARDIPAEAVWTIEDAAAYLQIPVSSIYKMTARKAVVRIPHVRIAGRLRFRRIDIDRWLELLTISNLDALAKVRQKVSQATHGNHPQAQAP